MTVQLVGPSDVDAHGHSSVCFLRCPQVVWNQALAISARLSKTNQPGEEPWASVLVSHFRKIPSP